VDACLAQRLRALDVVGPLRVAAVDDDVVAVEQLGELVENVPEVIKSWREGSVVKSWLLDLLDRALDEDPELADLKGYAEDTGEGRWTVDEAVRLAVPAHVISASLFARFASRQDDSPAMKAVAALRNQFGGHAVKR
jgi:6-phosphogluconate dehydrogenase